MTLRGALPRPADGMDLPRATRRNRRPPSRRRRRERQKPEPDPLGVARHFNVHLKNRLADRHYRPGDAVKRDQRCRGDAGAHARHQSEIQRGPTAHHGSADLFLPVHQERTFPGGASQRIESHRARDRRRAPFLRRDTLLRARTPCQIAVTKSRGLASGCFGTFQKWISRLKWIVKDLTVRKISGCTNSCPGQHHHWQYRLLLVRIAK